MSGICGIVCFEEKVPNNEEIQKMLNAMKNRGNDTEGILLDVNVGFGHKMLWTTSESLHENQPLSSQDKNLFLTSDARIDNRKELIKKLKITEDDYNVITDADLILWSYIKWGEDCPKYLMGDFAFAIWNNITEELFCVRDRLGLKSFFYTTEADIIKFASDILPLIDQTEYSFTPNIKSMQSFLSTGGRVAYGETMYQDIHALPPASIVIISKDNIKHIRYWFPEKIKINNNISFIEAVNSFKYLFNKAIENRMRSTYPIAIQLSGGLDSSSIVCSANLNDKYTNSFSTASLKYGSFHCDESKYIDSVLQKTGLNNITVHADKNDYKDLYSLEKYYKINPSWPAFVYTNAHFPLFEKLNSNNIRVVLTGLGGDEVTAGSRYALADYFKTFEWTKLCKELSYYNFNFQIIKQYLFLPILSHKQKNFIKKILKFFGFKVNISNTILDELKFSTLSQGDQMNTIFSTVYGHWADNDIINNVGRYNIEERHPFLDSELIEFLLTLPHEYKFSQGVRKRILREAMKGILPELVLNRNDKAVFSEVIFSQIKTIDLNEFWSQNYISDLGVVSPQEIVDLVESFRHTNINKKPHVIEKMWYLINLESWYRVNNKKYEGKI